MPAPVLVVDDDVSIVETLCEFLEMEGYAVLTAANGAEALETVRQLLPSVVLLDMRMPVLDGWGFARALREQGTSLPILVMTAAHDARLWAEEVGAAGYIAKPFDLIDVLSALEDVIQPGA